MERQQWHRHLALEELSQLARQLYDLATQGQAPADIRQAAENCRQLTIRRHVKRWPQDAAYFGMAPEGRSVEEILARPAGSQEQRQPGVE